MQTIDPSPICRSYPHFTELSLLLKFFNDVLLTTNAGDTMALVLLDSVIRLEFSLWLCGPQENFIPTWMFNQLIWHSLEIVSILPVK